MEERPLRTWNVPKDKINNWVSLYPDSTIRNDCAVNVLAFLGVIDVIKGQELSEKVSKTGMFIPQILTEINNSFDSIDSEFKHNHSIGNFKNIEDIYKKLDNNTFTIAMCWKPDNIGHSIVITKYNNVIYVLDPQGCYFQNFDTWWDANKSKYDYIQTIYQDKKARKRRETMIELRKHAEEIEPEKKKIRPNTRGGKHKKSIKKNTKKKRTQKKH